MSKQLKMGPLKAGGVVDSYIYYHSTRVCVVCGNKDFSRLVCETHEVVQEHKLRKIELRSSGQEMMLCPSHYYDVKEALK